MDSRRQKQRKRDKLGGHWRVQARLHHTWSNSQEERMETLDVGIILQIDQQCLWRRWGKQNRQMLLLGCWSMSSAMFLPLSVLRLRLFFSTVLVTAASQERFFWERRGAGMESRLCITDSVFYHRATLSSTLLDLTSTQCIGHSRVISNVKQIMFHFFSA